MKLTDYIHSNRRGKDANAFEQKALQDPFLQDALDGYDSVPGHHAQSIKDLEKRLTSPRKPSFSLYPYRWWIGGAAACLVLWLGISSLWNTQAPVNPETAQQMAQIPQTPPVAALVAADTDSVKQAKPRVAAVIRRKKKEKTQPKMTVRNVQVPQTMGEVMTLSSDDISALKPVQESKAVPVNFTVGGAISKQEDIESHLTGRVAGLSVQPQTLYGAKKEAVRQNPVLSGSKLIGRIVDETGAPLAGATVRLQNQMFSAVADVNGYFQLQAPRNPEDTLIFNYIGYVSRKLPLQSDIASVRMDPMQTGLSEVVVIKSSGKKGMTDARKANYNFGKAEFEAFFYKLAVPDMCNSKKQSIEAHFQINQNGRPVNLVVDQCECDELQAELKRILKISPDWSTVDQSVKLKLTVN